MKSENPSFLTYLKYFSSPNICILLGGYKYVCTYCIIPFYNFLNLAAIQFGDQFLSIHSDGPFEFEL